MIIDFILYIIVLICVIWIAKYGIKILINSYKISKYFEELEYLEKVEDIQQRLVSKYFKTFGINVDYVYKEKNHEYEVKVTLDKKPIYYKVEFENGNFKLSKKTFKKGL